MPERKGQQKRCALDLPLGNCQPSKAESVNRQSDLRGCREWVICCFPRASRTASRVSGSMASGSTAFGSAGRGSNVTLTRIPHVSEDFRHSGSLHELLERDDCVALGIDRRGRLARKLDHDDILCGLADPGDHFRRRDFGDGDSVSAPLEPRDDLVYERFMVRRRARNIRRRGRVGVGVGRGVAGCPSGYAREENGEPEGGRKGDVQKVTTAHVHGIFPGTGHSRFRQCTSVAQT